MLATLIAAVLLLADIAPPTDLSGTVVGPDKLPVPGATVYISSGAPKKGTAALNQYDYPDCQKSAVTDASGAFKIAGVDASLNYRVLVSAEGFRPVMLKKVDPVRGAVTATLKTLPKDVEAEQLLKGHVADANGAPIVGARIEPYGCQDGQKRWWGGVREVCEEEGYTDAKGDFTIVTKKPGVQIDLKVFGPRAAGRIFPLLAPGDSVHELGLLPGVSLTGKLLKDDKPLAGVTMKVVQKDRGVEHYLESWSAATGDEGNFTFKYLPANDDCLLYASQESLGDRGTLPLTGCLLTGDGTTVDAGNLSVEPGKHITGTLICSDGKPLPTGSKAYFGPWEGDDTIQVNVGADGKFEFKCVRTGLAQVWVRVNGYHVSSENQSFEPANAQFLLGVIEDDIDDLRMQLDPGPNEKSNYQSNKWNMLRTTRMTGVPPP